MKHPFIPGGGISGLKGVFCNQFNDASRVGKSRTGSKRETSSRQRGEGQHGSHRELQRGNGEISSLAYASHSNHLSVMSRKRRSQGEVALVGNLSFALTHQKDRGQRTYDLRFGWVGTWNSEVGTKIQEQTGQSEDATASQKRKRSGPKNLFLDGHIALTGRETASAMTAGTEQLKSPVLGQEGEGSSASLLSNQGAFKHSACASRGGRRNEGNTLLLFTSIQRRRA